MGSDGILYGPVSSEVAQFGLRIYNPDGGEAEKSGNGLRIFSRYLLDRGHVKRDESFSIETPGGVVTSNINSKTGLITVDMGKVSFSSKVIPVVGSVREVINEFIELNGKTYRYCAATIGNPHCVLPLEEISSELAHELGPLLEVHPNFPNRTNVQFLKILDRKNIQLEIWERGAGYTLASGSSSSAAASVARKLGLVEGNLTVHMPGGKIDIKIDDNYYVTMAGPVTRVGVMHFDKEALS